MGAVKSRVQIKQMALLVSLLCGSEGASEGASAGAGESRRIACAYFTNRWVDRGGRLGVGEVGANLFAG